jgi:hypothetical protein
MCLQSKTLQTVCWECSSVYFSGNCYDRIYYSLEYDDSDTIVIDNAEKYVRLYTNDFSIKYEFQIVQKDYDYKSKSNNIGKFSIDNGCSVYEDCLVTLSDGSYCEICTRIQKSEGILKHVPIVDMDWMINGYICIQCHKKQYDETILYINGNRRAVCQTCLVHLDVDNLKKYSVGVWLYIDMSVFYFDWNREYSRFLKTKLVQSH